MDFHDEGRFNILKNKYFTNYKKKWDNEMHYLVQDYQQQIFPQTISPHSQQFESVSLPKKNILPKSKDPPSISFQE
jgi:hypothetical protein